MRIGIVLKGLDNPFLVAMYEGARAEVDRRHVVASFRAATNVDDVNGQAARARALVGSGKPMIGDGTRHAAGTAASAAAR